MTKEQQNNSLSEFNQKYGDPWIWGIFIALILISIIENYSASSRNIDTMGVYMPVIKQCFFLGAGVLLAIFIARRDYNKLSFLAVSIPLLAVVTVATLLYVLFFGSVVNGAQRAIFLPGGITFQPTELSKLSIVTLLAFILATNQKDHGLTTKGLVEALVATGLYCALMIRSGATNCAIIVLICICMLCIGGASFKKLFITVVVGCVVGAGVFYIKSEGDHNGEAVSEAEAKYGIEQEASETANKPLVDRWEMRKERIRQWWNNDSLVFWPITSKNQQEVFSRMAQAHGGITGVGIGRSRECSRLPLAFSDYIYSIIIEETGLVGGVVMLLLFISLLGRALFIVRKCNRALPSLLIIGLALFITIQALIHMAINTGVFPVSGQPLPLISNGGTAILTICCSFGIMLSVSRTVTTGKLNMSNRRTPETELPAGLDAENPIMINPTPKNIWK